MSLTPLATFILSAMTSFVPLKDHRFTDATEDVTRARYETIAEAIATEVARDGNPFPNDTDNKRFGAVLASIGAAESGFIAKVGECTTTGDGGKALGYWQTHARREDVCNGLAGQVAVAAGYLRRSFQMCKHLELGDRLGGYTDGRCQPNWKRSRYRVERGIVFVKKAEKLENGR